MHFFNALLFQNLLNFQRVLEFLIKVLVIQSCPPLCDPMDCSPPGSSVHEILQARILEWVAISSSRGSSRLGLNSCISLHWLADSLPSELLGKPYGILNFVFNCLNIHLSDDKGLQKMIFLRVF